MEIAELGIELAADSVYSCVLSRTEQGYQGICALRPVSAAQGRQGKHFGSGPAGSHQLYPFPQFTACFSCATLRRSPFVTKAFLCRFWAIPHGCWAFCLVHTSVHLTKHSRRDFQWVLAVPNPPCSPVGTRAGCCFWWEPA